MADCSGVIFPDESNTCDSQMSPSNRNVLRQAGLLQTGITRMIRLSSLKDNNTIWTDILSQIFVALLMTNTNKKANSNRRSWFKQKHPSHMKVNCFLGGTCVLPLWIVQYRILSVAVSKLQTINQDISSLNEIWWTVKVNRTRLDTLMDCITFSCKRN